MKSSDVLLHDASPVSLDLPEQVDVLDSGDVQAKSLLPDVLRQLRMG